MQPDQDDNHNPNNNRNNNNNNNDKFFNNFPKKPNPNNNSSQTNNNNNNNNRQRLPLTNNKNIPRNTRITHHINNYRNSLPQTPYGQSNIFYKQITRSSSQQCFDYITIGYNIGRIPMHLEDLFAVIINSIHCEVNQNLKVVIDGDQLWITGTLVNINNNYIQIKQKQQKMQKKFNFKQQEEEQQQQQKEQPRPYQTNQMTPHNTTNYNIQQARLNQSLILTRNLLRSLLIELCQQGLAQRNDKQVLEKVQKVICKEIRRYYKNPDYDD